MSEPDPFTDKDGNRSLDDGTRRNAPNYDGAPYKPSWLVQKIIEIERYFYRDRANSQQHNAADRAHHRTANATVAIAILTLVLVGVGVSQAIVFNRQLTVMDGQLKEMKSAGEQTDKTITIITAQPQALKGQVEQMQTNNQLVANAITEANRAWLAPRRIILDGELSSKEYIPLQIEFRNVGRAPALGVVESMVANIIDAPRPMSPGVWNAYDLKYPENITCNGLSPAVGHRALFPIPDKDAKTVMRAIFPQDKNAVPDIINEKRILVVTGCFAYLTFQTTRQSAFCFYMRRDPDHLTDPKKRAFALCPIGNGAT